MSATARRAWLRLRWGRACSVCNLPPWINPPRDHANWLGHSWHRDPGNPPFPAPEGDA